MAQRQQRGKVHGGGAGGSWVRSGRATQTAGLSEAEQDGETSRWVPQEDRRSFGPEKEGEADQCPHRGLVTSRQTGVGLLYPETETNSSGPWP